VQDKRIQRLREDIDEGRELFREVAPKLEDPKRLLALIGEIFNYIEPVLSISADSSPHAAMFAIGQVQAGLKETEKHIAFYSDYRRKKAELERLSNDEGISGREHSADLAGTVAASVT
jgi:hypothetical protein